MMPFLLGISFASSPFPVSVDACRGSGDWSWCFWFVQVFLPVVGLPPSPKFFVFGTPTSSSLFTCMSPALSAMCACFFVALVDIRFRVLRWILCLCVFMPSPWVRWLVQRIVVRRSKSQRIRMYLCSLVGCLCDVVLNGVCRAVLKVVRRSMFNQYSASNSSQEISQNTAASILRHFLEGF